MSYQSIVVALIIGAALIYASVMLWRKIMSFSKKGTCGTSCGCSGAPGDAAKRT